MSLTTKLGLTLASTHTNVLDLATASFPLRYSKSVAYANGTGTNQADRVFSDQRTLAASATENLDLAGSLTDAFGATITFARIKAIMVAAAVGNTNNVNFIREATNGVPLFLAAGDGIPIRPGGAFAWFAPDATGVVVTAATGDLFTVTNSGSGTAVTYDIVIIGASV